MALAFFADLVLRSYSATRVIVDFGILHDGAVRLARAIRLLGPVLPASTQWAVPRRPFRLAQRPHRIPDLEHALDPGRGDRSGVRGPVRRALHPGPGRCCAAPGPVAERVPHDDAAAGQPEQLRPAGPGERVSAGRAPGPSPAGRRAARTVARGEAGVRFSPAAAAAPTPLADRRLGHRHSRCAERSGVLAHSAPWRFPVDSRDEPAVRPTGHQQLAVGDGRVLGGGPGRRWPCCGC